MSSSKRYLKCISLKVIKWQKNFQPLFRRSRLIISNNAGFYSTISFHVLSTRHQDGSSLRKSTLAQGIRLSSSCLRSAQLRGCCYTTLSLCGGTLRGITWYCHHNAVTIPPPDAYLDLRNMWRAFWKTSHVNLKRRLWNYF